MKKVFIKMVAYVVVLSLTWTWPASLALAKNSPGGSLEDDEILSVYEIIGELNLTPVQKEQLKEQRYQAELKMTDLHNNVRLRKLELRHELEKKEVDRAVVNRLVGELKALQGSMLEQRVDSILKVKEVLTAEQFEKLQSLSEQRKEKVKKGFIKRFRN